MNCLYAKFIYLKGIHATIFRFKNMLSNKILKLIASNSNHLANNNKNSIAMHRGLANHFICSFLTLATY